MRYQQQYTFENGSDKLIINAYTFEGAVEGLIEYVKNPLDWKENDGLYDEQVKLIAKIQTDKG